MKTKSPVRLVVEDVGSSAAEVERDSESIRIPVVEEQLEVSTRAVESGAVRLRKIVHEDIVRFDEELAVEVTEVERVAIDRPIDAQVAIRYEGDVTIVPVVEERIVTVKQLVLVEEIRITRRTRVLSTPQEATLRREEVIAERLDTASGEWKTVDAAGASRL